jgi:hypothetical protein
METPRLGGEKIHPLLSAHIVFRNEFGTMAKDKRTL